jgi:hypothetical protein
VQFVNCLTLFYRAWNGHIEQLHRLADRNVVKRLFQNSNDAKAISDHIQAITWSIQNLTVQFNLQVIYRLLVDFYCYKTGGECAHY